MTVRAYLENKLADIADKESRNGLTSGLVVQRREVTKKLSALTESESKKEYAPATPQKSTELSINGFGYNYD